MSVKEIFRLQNAAELEAAELKYLPARSPVSPCSASSSSKLGVPTYPTSADLTPLNS